MNYITILNILGWIIGSEGVMMLLPIACAAIYQESVGFYFALVAIVCTVIGFPLTRLKAGNKRFYAREGYVAVALAWIILPLLAAIPYTLSGEIPSYIDAVFEMVSGFTTTGASILPDVEALSRSMLFWRAFTQWIGGMGVLVFLMAVLPLTGGSSSFSLMQAESPGPSVSKLVPHLKETARHLYGLYLGLTIIEFLLLVVGRMPVFDALCSTFCTASTGGFGIWNTSIGGYSTYLQVVITIFMILFGANFTFFFLCVMRRFRDAFRMDEVRWYLAIIAGAILLIAVDVYWKQGGSFLYCFQQSAFQVSSMMTSTGFSSCDFDLWPAFSKAVLFCVMCIGACGGSTGGGIKVSRLLIYFKASYRFIRGLIHPKEIGVVRLDGRKLTAPVINNAMVFLICYIGIYIFSLLLLSLDCESFTSNFTAIAATINNTGPGFDQVGPTCNFAFYNPLSKIVLIFNMLAGRLELFPILILLLPSTWKK